MAASSVWVFLALAICLYGAAAQDLTIAKAERRVDLTSQVVRTLVSLKIENTGSEPISQFLFGLPKNPSVKLASISAATVTVKGKNKAHGAGLKVSPVEGTSYHTIVLAKALEAGQTANIDVQYALTHALKPFPEEIRQQDYQLVLHEDSAYLLSPYLVKHQTTVFKVPSSRVESYTKIEPTRFSEKEKEIKFGPYENVSPSSEAPLVIHFENSQPFAVVELLEQEFEISHWGNVYVTENYLLKHDGARLKGSFSRLDYQSKGSGITAFRKTVAILPPRAHSIYYRDEIGNISTSHVRSEAQRTVVEFEPRYPLFGGWQVKFTLGYSVPLKDFVFSAPDGRRYFKSSFGSPISDVVIDKIVIKIVLPEGSRIQEDKPLELAFPVDDVHKEVKHTYLDTVGRTVLVVTKENVVFEHGVPFKVYYRFSPLAMLAEPLMLVVGFFCFFLACMAYIHFDFPISKASGSYQARVQQEEVLALLQLLQKIMKRRLSEAEKLEASLRDLARTGDVSTCKASKKAADAAFKESSKEVKTIHDAIQTSSRSTNVMPKVESLISKEKEKQDRLLQKLSLTVDLYERKLSNKEIDARLAPHEQKYAQLKQDVAELLDTLDD